MKKFIRITAFLLCFLLVASLCACGTKEKTLLTLEDHTLSLNTYQFLLSRMKGTLSSYGYDVDDTKFWNTIISTDGTTYNDYFCSSVLDQASKYVIAEYLFAQKGLELTEEREKIVDDLMAAQVKKAGSKNALNSELKGYGINYEMLREIYLTETRIDMLKDKLYGEKGELIDKETKDKYLSDNYVAFGQLFVAGYYYVIDTDKFGDQVYYTDEKHTAIAYDKENGHTKKDEYGLQEKDVLGGIVYYNDEGKIAYDKKNGVLGYATRNGEKVIENYDDAKLSELYADAVKYAEDANGSIDDFKELAEIYGSGEFDGDITYLFSSPGYYAAQYNGYEYLDEITKALANMKVGECKVVSSEYGYHVICKYEIEDAVYDSKEQADVFSDFYDGLVSYLFDLECAKHESKVKIDKGVLGEAPDMISVGTNTMY